MAGDWIKWEKGLAGKPEVLRMAAALRRSPTEIAGACMMLWEWADSNVGEDGIAQGLTLETLGALQERCSGVTHLCEQLVAVGWLRPTADGVEFANYCRHNGKSAKIRAQNLDRLKRFRNAPAVSKALPEKRREDVSTSVDTTTATKRQTRAQQHDDAVAAAVIPAKLDTPEFRQQWQRWCDKRREMGKYHTATSVQASLEKLLAHPVEAATQALLDAASAGYQGVFPKATASGAAPDRRGLALGQILDSRKRDYSLTPEQQEEAREMPF